MPSGIYEHKLHQGFQKGHSFYGNISRSNYFHKGEHNGVEFRKGNKKSGKAYSWDSGDKHPLWKGDSVGYGALHSWVKRWKGKSLYCENCGKNGKILKRVWSIDWANIDHKYRRVLEDYIGLCKSCHKLYDIENNLKK